MSSLRIEVHVRIFGEEDDSEIFESDMSFSGLNKKEANIIKNNLLPAITLDEETERL